MEKVKRYKVWAFNTDPALLQDENGDLVMYGAHLAAVHAARLEGAEAAIRDAENIVCWPCRRLNYIGPNPDCEDCNQRVQTVKEEAARIVAAIEQKEG